MAKHDVTFTVPEVSLGNVDIAFSVKKDKEVLGKLMLSKGGAKWFPKHAKKGLEVSWATLADLIENHKAPK